MPELLTLAPGVAVPRPEDGSVIRYSSQAVQDVVDFFSLLCFGQNEWAGKPFKLAEWELEAVRQFYGVQVQDEDGSWVRLRRFLYEEIPKKNGKSEFAAGLGLLHLLWDGESVPQVGIFAADKNNADIIYQCAKYMVEHTCLGQPEHAPIAWARDSRREIHTKYGGVLKVYSADAETKHGYSFSAIIIDELHAQPNRKLWDVLTAGSDAARRQQAVIVLTTAGDDPDRKSIGWEIHEKCRRHPGLAAGRTRAGAGRGRPGLVSHHVRRVRPHRGRPGQDRRPGHLGRGGMAGLQPGAGAQPEPAEVPGRGPGRPAERERRAAVPVAAAQPVDRLPRRWAGYP